MSKVIEQRYLIKASGEKVWDALTNPETISAWGGGPAKMSDEVGSEFSLWGGDVFGKNIEVDRTRKLVQEWYGGEWEMPSVVTFTLNPDDHSTEVVLNHKDVPEDQVADIDEGWRDFYMGPLKKLLENK